MPSTLPNLSDLNSSEGQHVFARRITVPDRFIPSDYRGALWRLSKGPVAKEKMDEFNGTVEGRLDTCVIEQLLVRLLK